MKIKIKKDLLLENLNKVSRALSTKNLVPALSGIKFDLKKDGLTLTASDNDITIQAFIANNDEDMENIEEGSIIIQGKYILDIVRKIPDKMINLEVFDEMKVIISTENSEYNLNGINNKEYPNINLEFSKTPITINNKEFKDLVNQTAFAASTDEARLPLTGVNLKIVGNILECNCTDSYRLARKVINIISGDQSEYNIIIPSKNIIDVSKLLIDDNKEVELHIFNNKILFKYDNILFQSRLINGTYPNTSNLVPKESMLKLTVKVDDLYNVIDRVSVFTNDKEKNVVTLETNGNILTMKSSSAEIGRVEEKMMIKKDKEEDITISFSARYVMEALKVLDSEECEISFVGEVNPIILKANETDNLMQLVLPIRTY